MPIALFVHGGAGPAAADDRADDCAQGCLAAARVGYAVLARGGRALDAVEAAVAALEDDPRFNAGVGSALNSDGEVEMDASLMDGETLAAGAVTLVRTFKNPVRLARAVLEHTPHVLLGGEGAARLGRELGFAEVDPAGLVTSRARDRLSQHRGQPGGGTVGAVAVDAKGHVAAATSTGGMTGKRPGRIGDTPLIGCGTYADDLSGAASATGVGEAIIKTVLAKRACDELRGGATPDEAAQRAVSGLERAGGYGGLIVVDRTGRLGFALTTGRMGRASIDARGLERA
ncbi:MAG: isoaspartyl peptidase/L-asparaginase family protein, partial [Myxococcaceae bacterium]